MPTTLIDSAVFRDIFSTEAMRRVFSDENRVQKYLDFEAALARAQARLGIIPKEAAEEICRHCNAAEIDFAKLKTQTERIGYPVLPVVQQLVALCRDGLGEWCHWGATTQDITDSATVMQIREALDLVEADLDGIADALAGLARKLPRHADGRAQQSAAGGADHLRLQDGDAARRVRAAQQRLQRVAPARAGRRIRRRRRHALLARQPRLKVAGRADEGARDSASRRSPGTRCATRIAEVGCFLGLVTGTCGKIAFDVKLMMQTEVEELYEPFHEGRGSSSTMPQKRNPISSVYITALTAVVRQQVAALLDAMVEDHERATGPWEIEWIVLPEIFCSPPARWRRPASCSPACRSMKRRCAPIST